MLPIKALRRTKHVRSVIGRARDLRGRGRAMKQIVFLCICCFCTTQAWADAHGPAFGYSTTTLGSGDSSIETVLTWRSGVAMLGPRFSYGVTENLQFSISAPFDLNYGQHPVGRFTATMPGEPLAEGLVAWRFHHALTGVGTRNESTLYMGIGGTTQTLPRTDGPPLNREPSYYIAAATGHISRSYYVWAGGGYQLYGHWGGSEDHQSNSLLTSVVVGWRPQFFYKDYPRPDIRFFWETTGDWVGMARRGGTSATPPTGGHFRSLATLASPAPTPDSVVLPNSGGEGIYSGPSFLYTYRDIAIQGGVLFPLWNQLNGTQPSEGIRSFIGVSYFFLKGRR
jgi:hypothetical protein